MKRALSWLLVLVMVFSMIPLAAFADETTWTEAGSYAVVADTMYVLEPAEPGVYTITAAEGALFSICNAASGFPMESDVSTYDFTVQQVGPSVGVIAAADTTINVVRTGDAPAPIEWVDYEIGYTLTPDMMPACMCLGTGDESFYLVNFNHATISLTAMLETTGANYADPDNGVYINYTNALREYVAVANSDSNPVKGYWILDNHLYQMLNHLYVAKDWGRYLDSIMDLTVEAHMEHTDVQTVTLEDGYNYEICMACESLLWTDCPGYFEDNPIMLDVVWNGAVGTATVTLEAGECGYYGARTNGATWTVNGKEPEYVYVPTFPMAPSSIWLENMTGAPMTFEIVLTMPAGTQTNPDTLVLGENSITVKEGATEYYYHYEATEDGIFTLTMPESGWFYVINNMTTGQYGDWQYSDSEPVVNPGTVEVSAGDVLEIQVNTYNPDNPWSAPAGTLTFTASMSGAGSDVPPAGSVLTLAEAIALGESVDDYTEGKYYVTGIVDDLYNTMYGNMHLIDAEGNDLVLYGMYSADGEVRYDAMDVKPVNGDTVTVYGVIGNFKGTAQMKNGWLVEHIVAEKPEAPADPEADSELTIAEAIALGESKDHNVYTENKYYVVGTVKDVYNETYGNMHIVDEDGNELTIYGSYDMDGSNRYDAMFMKPVAGDTVVLYGIIGQYNGTAQMKNGWIVDYKCGHDLTHYEAVEAECHNEGSVEYWTCSKCGGFWLDEACTRMTNAMSIYLPATGEGNVVHMDAVEPGCHYEGNSEYWICYDCEKVWADEDLTQLTNIKNVVVPAKGSNLLVHNEAIEPACHYDGCIEHWICYECNQVWTDEALTQLSNVKNVVVPATHNPEAIHVEAVAPTCAAEGNIEYWYCEECGQVWTDEALTQLSNMMNVRLPLADHTLLIHMDAVEPGCHFDGNIEYWVCYACEKVWQDEALTQLTNIKNVVLPATHEPEAIHVEAVAPTCYTEGNIEYWYCENCNGFWADEACTQITNRMSVKLGALEHANVVHMEAVEPGCHYTGNVEHWYCQDCDTVWTDEELTQISNHLNVIVPMTGDDSLLVHMDAVEPGCHFDGNIEHWVCYKCEQVWQDEALTQLTNIKNVVVPAKGSNLLVHNEAIEPACHYDGCIEHWICYECNQVWTDEALTQLSNVKNVVVPATHNPEAIHVEAVAPTCAAEGNIEYWYCEECGQVWTDEALTQLSNMLNVRVPLADHTLLIHMEAIEPGCHFDGNIEYWVCYACEKVWQDEALTQLTNIKNVILPATHEPEAIHVEAVAPTCYTEGNIEYWYCENCNGVWADEACTQVTNRMSVKLGALEHANIIHMEAVEPGCHYTGNVEHWYCADCDTVWTDEEMTQISNHLNVIVPMTGDDSLLVHMDAVEPGCHFDGNIEHWVCYKCEQVWQDEALTQLTNIKNVVVPAKGSNLLVHNEAIEPACHYDGCIEHWICYECNQVWTDEALTQLSNVKNVVVPATHNPEAIHVEAVAPTCEAEGNIEYWYCEECGQVWTDEALTQLSNMLNVRLPLADHELLIHMDAVEPGCHFEGNIEYWVCYACEKVWQDEALTQLTNIKNVVLPAKGSNLLVHNEAIEPGCHYDGCIEHWICYECNKVWTDEALTKLSNVKNVVLPATHDPEAIHVEAVAPGCEAEGNIEYWYCEECGQVWQDEALTQLTNIKNVILPATHNNIVHMDAVEPGCHYDGHIEHWYCADCGIVWANEGFTQVTNHKNVIIPAIGGGNVEHIEAVAPSCYANGNIEHWYCKDCGQVWQNEALTQLTNLKNVVVAAQCTNIIHIEAVEPGCHYQGNIEHWYCADCDTVWQDENRTQITNHKNVVVPELGGKVIHVAAVEATCVATGNIEYWYCEQCEQVWQDEARTQLTNFKNVITVGDHTPDKEGIRFEFSGNPTVIRSEITATYTFGCAYCDEKVEGKAVVETVVVEAPTCEETGLVNYVASVELNGVEYTSDDTNDSITNIKVPALGHDLVHIDAVAPGCHFDGNIEHWYCTGCEIVWADAELTQVTNHKNVIVPALGGEVVHVEAVEPGCEKEGNIEHWYCEECEQVWQNEALTQLTNHKNVILPAAHKNIVHIDAVAPGCHYEGNTEHWYCADCDMVWADEGLNYITNHKNVIIPATGEGKLAHIEAVAPGCHFDGNIEYWICYECEQVWQNKALTQLTNIKNVILPALGGEVVHVDAVEPGCENEGNIEHWYCEECEQVWTDEALTKLSNHLSVKLGITHNVVHMDAVKPGCHYNGNIEYWYCPDCGAHWTDELCREVTNSKNVILPATGGEVIHVPAAEPSCKEGNIEYWYCEECEQVWQNEALTQLTNFKNVLIPSKGEHALNMDNLIWSWSADKKSAEAFTYCSGCESNVVFYADVVAEAPLTATSEDHKNITTTYHYFTATVTYKGQTYTNKCVVVDPTCRHVGFTSYFGDVLIGNTVYNYPEYTKDFVMGSPWGKWEVQKKLAHQWIEEGKVGDKNYKKYCANCNLDYKNVATGDAIMTSVIIMVLAGAAVVLLLTKKRRIA